MSFIGKCLISSALSRNKFSFRTATRATFHSKKKPCDFSLDIIIKSSSTAPDGAQIDLT